MRLDKFLKVSRLIKRRTIAQALCDAGQVFLNGKVAKPASTVDVGQELTITRGPYTLTVRIEVVPIRAVATQEAASLYTLLHQSKADLLTELAD